MRSALEVIPSASPWLKFEAAKAPVPVPVPSSSSADADKGHREGLRIYFCQYILGCTKKPILVPR
jgi:hypothetical protein